MGQTGNTLCDKNTTQRNSDMNLIMEPKEYVQDLLAQGYTPQVIAFYAPGIEHVSEKYKQEVERLAKEEF